MIRFDSHLRSIYFCVSFAAAMMLAFAPARTEADERSGDPDVVTLSAETYRIYGRADRAIKDLDGYLTAIRYQRTAFIGTNYFGVSVGGIDSIRDLQEGRGVDPETLAALYAGFAIPSVAADLNLTQVRDPRGRVVLKIDAPDGRLRYKDAVVRMYSPERLRELFDRRASFRTDNERVRNQIFSAYTAARRRRVGNQDLTGLGTESQELSRRFRELQPILADLETALRAEASMNSIIGGPGGQHFFGYSVGGINVLEELTQRKAVDPETFAAIFADRVSLDFADSFTIRDGRVFYQDDEIRMYSALKLKDCFRDRNRLALRTGQR